jgi:hypothetical protein
MKLSMQFAAWFLLALEGSIIVSSFSTVKVVPARTTMTQSSHTSPLCMSTTEEDNKTEMTDVATDALFIPVSFDEMVKQSSAAMKGAYAAGVTRQSLRILLPRSADNDQLLQYYENDADTADMSQTVLAPPDETWQGGIMQLYRAASFASQEILR